MRVQYDTTLDEVVDTHLRLLNRSKLAVTWRRQGTLATALLTGLAGYFTFGIFSMPGLAGNLGSLLPRLFGAVVCAVIAALWYPGTYQKTLVNRTRRLLREQLGTDGPIPFQVELTETGIWTRQASTQLTFDWSSVKEFEETSDSLDFFTKEGGIVVVRRRAFSSAEHLLQFRELAEQHLRTAHKYPP